MSRSQDLQGAPTLNFANLASANLNKPPFSWVQTWRPLNLTGVATVVGTNFSGVTGVPLLTQLYATASYQTRNLAGINLQANNLTGWNFSTQNLTLANLLSANLTSSNLTLSDLAGANLAGANLTSANITAGNLTSANLTSATLVFTNLASANLTAANFRTANLTSTNLAQANMTSADLTSATLDFRQLRRCSCCRHYFLRNHRFHAYAALFHGQLSWPPSERYHVARGHEPYRQRFVQPESVHGTTYLGSIGLREPRIGEPVARKPFLRFIDFRQSCIGQPEHRLLPIGQSG